MGNSDGRSDCFFITNCFNSRTVVNPSSIVHATSNTSWFQNLSTLFASISNFTIRFNKYLKRETQILYRKELIVLEVWNLVKRVRIHLPSMKKKVKFGN